MPEPIPAAAPAHQPETVSATRDAASRGDFNAFDKADQAARRGQALPDVAVPPPVANDDADPDYAPAVAAPASAPVDGAAPPVAARPLSKRQLEINEHVRARTAAELEAKTLRDQLAALQAPPRREPVREPAPAEDLEPNPDDATKYPAGQYEPQFVKDLAAWQTRQTTKETEAAAHQRAQTEQYAKARADRDRAFAAHLDDAKKTNPAVLSTIAPDVLALRPRDALQQGEAATALNVVAECLLSSPMPLVVMQHLTAHPDVFQRLAALPSVNAVIYEMGLLHGELKTPAAPPAFAPAASSPPLKVISDAPPPAPILSTPQTSSDPKAAALARGDFAAFDKLDLQSRRAQRAGASQG